MTRGNPDYAGAYPGYGGRVLLSEPALLAKRTCDSIREQARSYNNSVGRHVGASSFAINEYEVRRGNPAGYCSGVEESLIEYNVFR